MAGGEVLFVSTGANTESVAAKDVKIQLQQKEQQKIPEEDHTKVIK